MTKKEELPVQPTMLYKPDGTHKFDGVMVEFQVFEGASVKDALSDGWVRTVAETQKSKPKG